MPSTGPSAVASEPATPAATTYQAASDQTSRCRPVIGCPAGRSMRCRFRGSTREEIPTSSANEMVSTAVSIASPRGGWNGTEDTAAKAKMWNRDPDGRRFQ
ncbi:hypothetical protein ACFFX0_22205 [Citricoccus parietis]|uniref:Uncharacterized protein n=1 Tax=Citricoccus parietis TaxID=592307 RepID=A0ABV5G4A5_9MICC